MVYSLPDPVPFGSATIGRRSGLLPNLPGVDLNVSEVKNKLQKVQVFQV
jgi:hypothetical protein